MDHYYLAKGKPDPLVTPALRADFEDAMFGTVRRNRASVIPWLSSIHSLAGMRVLEVGTGAGGSIVPLAEQGAFVVGTDIDEQSLVVAEDRCQIYGLTGHIQLHRLNATELAAKFSGQQSMQ